MFGFSCQSFHKHQHKGWWRRLQVLLHLLIPVFQVWRWQLSHTPATLKYVISFRNYVFAEIEFISCWSCTYTTWSLVSWLLWLETVINRFTQWKICTTLSLTFICKIKLYTQRQLTIIENLKALKAIY